MSAMFTLYFFAFLASVLREKACAAFTASSSCLQHSNECTNNDGLLKKTTKHDEYEAQSAVINRLFIYDPCLICVFFCGHIHNAKST